MNIAAAALASATAHVRRLGGGEPLDIPVLRIVITLVICVSIAALAILLIRQRRGHDVLRRWTAGFARSAPAIDVVEVRRLGMHADVALVRHDMCEYLILVQTTGTRVLNRSRSSPPGTDGDEVS